MAVAAIGMVVGWRLFGFFAAAWARALDTVQRLTDRVRPLYVGSFHKWYFDDLNDLLFVRIGGLSSRRPLVVRRPRHRRRRQRRRRR